MQPSAVDRTWRSSVWRIAKTMISQRSESLCTKNWTHHYMQVKLAGSGQSLLVTKRTPGQSGSASHLWQESSCRSKKGTMETGGKGEGQKDVWMYILGVTDLHLNYLQSEIYETRSSLKFKSLAGFGSKSGLLIIYFLFLPPSLYMPSGDGHIFYIDPLVCLFTTRASIKSANAINHWPDDRCGNENDKWGWTQSRFILYTAAWDKLGLNVCPSKTTRKQCGSHVLLLINNMMLISIYKGQKSL